ncbi:hypothetical protein JMJ35_007488 [Cladonia borealis]|uniref:Uncharacterized protein n=1 Tax=Cladonia borealis TaxID=184061 RepID=A0AA39QY49_9LECA|nr:hypothetical protein JMJ35_007488 [Cladonia borealis]
MASWQVDVPGLSQLVMNVGVHGLKQLALSGVDIHTVGCMLMVGEMIPASQEFRQELNRRREKQRTERRWLYNLVEIGAGSFFLVDQFLKTRAGENVLALMASIVPLMSESACPAVLGGLFEVAGVSMDHTPGVNQFLKLRDGLLTFSRNVGFQERVLTYHALLDQLVNAVRNEHPCTNRSDPYDAIPSRQDIPRLIQLCHKVATSTDSVILSYKGLHGSGWLAAFGSYVIGLPVCALDSSGMQVPISDHYGKAKIILDPSAKSGYGLLTAGELSDFISVERLDDASRLGWSVNCNELNYFSTNHPEFEHSGLIDAVSDLTAIMTLREVWKMSQPISEVGPSDGFVPYLVSILPQIQERSLDTLSSLGFKVKPRSHFAFTSDSLCRGTRDGPELENESPPFKSEEFLDRFLPPFYTQGIEQFMGIENVEGTYGGWKRTSMYDLCKYLHTAASIASHLAFTDWNSSLQTLSVRNFYGRRRFSGNIELEHVTLPYDFRKFLSNALIASTDVVTTQTLDQQLAFSDWLAIDFDGVVVLRNLAIRPSIANADGIILSFSMGHIAFEGERKKIVNMDVPKLNTGNSSDPDESLSYSQVVKTVTPNLQSRFLFSDYKDVLWARHEIFTDVEFVTNADGVRISENIMGLWVAEPCGHSCSVTGQPAPSRVKFMAPELDFFEEIEADIYCLAGKLDGLSAWLACQGPHKPSWRPLIGILQEKACLDCICCNIPSNYDIYFIIPGTAD